MGAVRSATPALNALGSSAPTKSLTGSTSTLSAPDGSEVDDVVNVRVEQVINAEGPQQVGVRVVAQKAKRVSRCARGRVNAFGSNAPIKSLSAGCISRGGSDRDRTHQFVNVRVELGIKAAGPQQVGVGVVAQKAKRVSRCSPRR